MNKLNESHRTTVLNRRQIVQGATALSLASMIPTLAQAQTTPELILETRTLDVKGKAAKVYGIRGPSGGQGLVMNFGNQFRARVTNTLTENTLIHWHGLTPPTAFDGVPMLSGPALATGDSRDYAFDMRIAGTHWMHSHMGLQEQNLLAAPLIVRETEANLFDEQEHVVMLHDFTFRDPQEILAELQGGGGAHAMHAQKPEQPMDHSKMDHSKMPNMQMGAMLNDIAYDAMLANDRTMDDPQIVKAERGGRFRLRIINGAAATNVWINLGELKGSLIAVDGNTIQPVEGSVFPLAIAQRADIRLTLPPGGGAWPILFQAEGSPLRSGIILAAGDVAIGKLSDQGEPGAPVDLAMESQLVSVVEPPDEPVTRTETLMLTGGEENYLWGLNGKSEMHQTLFRVRQGEQIDVIMHNMTGMAHPMHLHGHYFRVVAIGNRKIKGAIRDTVLVPIGETVTIRFTADNPGTWAFHCHHLYHMNSGMMGAIAYTGSA